MAEGWAYATARESGVKKFYGTTQEATQAVKVCQASLEFLQAFQLVGKQPVEMVSYDYDTEELEVYIKTLYKLSLPVGDSELEDLETLFCTKVAPFLAGIYG